MGPVAADGVALRVTVGSMALLPIFQVKNPTIMQWQNRWKALLDPVLSKVPQLPNTKLVQLPSALVLTTSADSVVVATVNFSTTGGQVLINLQDGQGASVANPTGIAWETFVPNPAVSPQVFSGVVYLLRDGITIQTSNVGIILPQNTNDLFLPLTLTCLDSPPAGPHIYTVGINAVGSTTPPDFFTISSSLMVLRELP